jgi:prevent-host-death family protein
VAVSVLVRGLQLTLIVLTRLTSLLVSKEDLMAARTRWSLQDAKAQFSELVRRTIAAGPQVVTRNGEDAVVIVSAAEYNRMQRPAKTSLARTLADSPLSDVTLTIPRPRTTGRSTKL